MPEEIGIAGEASRLQKIAAVRPVATLWQPKVIKEVRSQPACCQQKLTVQLGIRRWHSARHPDSVTGLEEVRSTSKLIEINNLRLLPFEG